MSFLNGFVELIFNVNRTLEIGSVKFDAFTKEEHGAKLSLTDIPVEDGRTINDHSILAPRTLSIQSIRSETPISFGGALGRSVGEFLQAGSGDKTSFDSDSSTVWQALIEVLEERVPLEIVTLLDRYKDMVLLSLVAVTDKDSSKIIGVDMVFQEFRTVQTKEAVIAENKISNENISDQATGNKDGGVAPTTEEAAPYQSWLVDGIEGVTGEVF